MTDNPAALLADVLARENEALARVDYAAATALIGAKETALAALTQGPKPPAEHLQHLGELAQTNRELLERAIAVQTSVVRIVARACAPPTTTAHYSRNGTEAPRQRAGALALSARV
ncbi:MAG TPA: hypothetical protein DDZ81_17040 [Acetobacteraceae bacterium]|jgi:hypothetical protein|nr:hypothetical protein [Acetobacteraceae bacterium]